MMISKIPKRMDARFQEQYKGLNAKTLTEIPNLSKGNEACAQEQNYKNIL